MTGYRDDRDAIHRRMENLEEDLRVAKEELAGKTDDDERAKKISAVEQQMAEARRQLDRMGAQLEGLRGKPAPRKLGRLLFGALGAAVVLLGATFWVVKSAPPAPAPAPVETHPILPPPSTATPVPTPTHAPSAEPAPTSPPAEMHSKQVEWQGKVTQVTGSTVKNGAPCTVSARLDSRGDKLQVGKADVTCGGEAIYRSTDKFQGTSQNGAASREFPELAGAQSYIIIYRDQGTRTGRSQVSFDSTKGKGAVWVEGMPAWRIEFSLAQTSKPDVEAPLLDDTRKAIRRSATVDKVDGVGAPVRAKDRCSMVAWVDSGSSDQCDVHVKCGAKFLYGGGDFGLTHCTLADGAIATAHDDTTTRNGGDPSLQLDIAGGSLVVSDDPNEKPWTAHLTLAPSAN